MSKYIFTRRQSEIVQLWHLNDCYSDAMHTCVGRVRAHNVDRKSSVSEFLPHYCPVVQAAAAWAGQHCLPCVQLCTARPWTTQSTNVRTICTICTIYLYYRCDDEGCSSIS